MRSRSWLTAHPLLLGLTALCLSVYVAGTTFMLTHQPPTRPTDGTAETIPDQPVNADQLITQRFGDDIRYEAPSDTINALVGKDFDLKDVENIPDMERAYGFTFSPEERRALSERKFVLKRVTDTSIEPRSIEDSTREFIELYEGVKGPNNPLERGQQHSVFFSSDVFFNAYNNLYVELLKEMENEKFYPAIKSTSQRLFEAAEQKRVAATSDAEIRKWTKVRNYFALPYAIFSTVAQPLKSDDYMNDGQYRDPNEVMSAFMEKDKTIDTAEHVTEFIRNLKLDHESERALLADAASIYDPKGASTPEVFKPEFETYRDQEGIDFKVDFTQFTPRGTYTGSSLRRQYFRGMKWYIMVPFFVKSPDLTAYAFGASQLLAEDAQALDDYNKLESAIGFMVGTSDDLMPVDYLQALYETKDAPDREQALLTYLTKARNPRIKDLSAYYPAVGTEQSDDVRLKTKGLRFFSGKFIIDSYWTGFLTQGDEAVRPGYTQKLPPMASALEVMDLLGSDYASSQIPHLDFYKPENKNAIEQALAELRAETAKITEEDWRQNLYTSWLWVIRGLFSWEASHRSTLPKFMQSISWEAKTLQTASAFWTELRHATILYAKQSFAELGGGGGACDPRKMPPAPKGYIEPQREAYHRLNYLAKRTHKGLSDMGFNLINLNRLEEFSKLMDLVESYTEKELANATLHENILTNQYEDADQPSGICVYQTIEDGSDWETLRLKVVEGLNNAKPQPVEGLVMSAKDKRAGIVADVHTGGDSANPTRILYEGEGIPYVIFTAVSDANGPRLTVGFVSSHYEFTQEYGGKRMTDEDWQKKFYEGEDSYNAFKYLDPSSWPATPFWYAPLFNLK